MNTILSDIREHFASHVQGLRRLQNEALEFSAYTFRQGPEYGVAIEIQSSKDVYEEAAQITLRTMNFMGKRYITLACCDEQFRNEFARFASHFVDPGIDGDNRKLVTENPLSWWEKWIGMLGNIVAGRKSYDTIAEMLALTALYKEDPSISWTASQAGSHDIESNKAAYEIKSTIKKAETQVTISSQFQLFSEKPLQLWFYRMEASEHGVSINDVKKQLVSVGYDKDLIESQLEERGFIIGSSIRDRKYVVLEARKYKVDDSFPRIIESSFKNDQYPKNIVKILYTIDLEGLEYSI